MLIRKINPMAGGNRCFLFCFLFFFLNRLLRKGKERYGGTLEKDKPEGQERVGLYFSFN